MALSAVLPSVQYLLADKAYDANHYCNFLASQNIQPVIPAQSNRRVHIHHDELRYKHRNTVQRMFGRIKDWRRVATRYDKLARNFMAAIRLASLIGFWI